MSDDDLSKEMTGWLQSQDMEVTTAYLKRGRAFSSLSLSELTDQWAATFKDVDEYVSNFEVRNLSSYCMAEFRLRGVEPPTEVIKADFARIQKRLRKMMKSMPKEAYNDMAAGLAEDLEEYRWQRDRDSKRMG
jgi:exopolyphosphatase/pppGpp-phosphohydrolase